MKILYVITGLGQGGAERVVCDLADKMYEKGNEVKIVYLTGNVLTQPINKEIELIKVNLNSIFSLPIAYINLSKVIRDFAPEVVHSHMIHANILTRLIRVNTPIKKLICTAHSNNEGGSLRMLAYRITHNLASLTTNVSKEASQAFIAKKAVPYGGIQCVYNGIDINKFYWRPEARKKILKELNLNESIYLILAVGRFNEHKDYPNLLNAIALFKTQYKENFKLIIAGDGELREEIEKLIKELGLEEDIILLGRRNDIPYLMSAADLFVLSSKYEGFGLVVAEAMVCETLVIATDCGGVGEVLNNPNFLVQTSNSYNMAKKIYNTTQIEDSLKKEIILKNLKHVQENFSLDFILEKWLRIYNEK